MNLLTFNYLKKKNLKKKTINVFIPMLFGFKNNKITKTFFYENMYYKIFYLIFNHIKLTEVFFKNKKIFYNFSKYFQINLYIFLLKTKQTAFLDLFFYFFYILFITFENFENSYSNKLFFKGYKMQKYNKFFKKWKKLDKNLNFYYKQRINSISLYVYNYLIYKNNFLLKFNLFLNKTLLIYKLFYYFKILQYKIQSFVILYKKHFRVEKKTRLLFAKNNCTVFNNLNYKLIKYLSNYKIKLKKIKKKNLNINLSIIKKIKNKKKLFVLNNLNNKLINKKKLKKKAINKREKKKKKIINKKKIIINKKFINSINRINRINKKKLKKILDKLIFLKLNNNIIKKIVINNFFNKILLFNSPFKKLQFKQNCIHIIKLFICKFFSLNSLTDNLFVNLIFNNLKIIKIINIFINIKIINKMSLVKIYFYFFYNFFLKKKINIIKLKRVNIKLLNNNLIKNKKKNKIKLFFFKKINNMNFIRKNRQLKLFKILKKKKKNIYNIRKINNFFFKKKLNNLILKKKINVNFSNNIFFKKMFSFLRNYVTFVNINKLKKKKKISRKINFNNYLNDTLKLIDKSFSIAINNEAYFLAIQLFEQLIFLSFKIKNLKINQFKLKVLEKRKKDVINLKKIKKNKYKKLKKIKKKKYEKRMNKKVKIYKNLKKKKFKSFFLKNKKKKFKRRKTLSLLFFNDLFLKEIIFNIFFFKNKSLRDKFYLKFFKRIKITNRCFKNNYYKRLFFKQYNKIRSRLVNKFKFRKFLKTKKLVKKNILNKKKLKLTKKNILNTKKKQLILNHKNNLSSYFYDLKLSLLIKKKILIFFHKNKNKFKKKPIFVLRKHVINFKIFNLKKKNFKPFIFKPFKNKWFKNKKHINKKKFKKKKFNPRFNKPIIKKKKKKLSKKKAKFVEKVKEILIKLKKKNLVNYNKYFYFFKILLKTRLKLLKKKTLFKVFFLVFLKQLIKTILFKNKIVYFNLIRFPFNSLNIYNEYKLWFFNYKKLIKIPFKLIKLYAKFYFNKLLYNLKLKSIYFKLYNKYLQSRYKTRFKKLNLLKFKFRKNKVRKIFVYRFYRLFKHNFKYFISSGNVLYSLKRNKKVFIHYKQHEKYNIQIFLKNLKKRRSYYISRHTYYSNFFFIYWAKKFYEYKLYSDDKNSLNELYSLHYYFKFLKSKTFFFNYLINFCFLYIQKINSNLLNYVFILNQYKTKLIISLEEFYKYLILFFFKRNQYFNFKQVNNNFKEILPNYFSFFSIFFNQLSVELIHWYSLLNNSTLYSYKSTFLFNSCFLLHNTSALYLHHKYKYLYYYRVYSFYIFYIFYYLYNHLFKLYKKLNLKHFKLSYDLIKYNEYNRYYLGLRTRILILTIRNRYKRGFTIEKIFKNLKFFLRESLKKKELVGYYISIKGRYKRSSRSNKLIIKKGLYSFNNIDLKLDSSYGTLNTRFGIAGVKVIFAFK